MKRIVPPLDPPATPRRKRSLSEEERALWDSVAKQVKPLRGRPRLTKIEVPMPSPAAPAVKPPLPVGSQQPVKRPVKLATPMSPPPLAALGRRERTHLSRGRKDIDARIDLHGMTQARAHHALLRFLQGASHDGLSFVLVITGKGSRLGGDPERGVLRRQVPHWLSLPEFRAYVIGFDEAAIGHGGEGALYVRVRRARGY
ncbi:MAG: Smr/MutS family protein [Rhodopseudomonas palustris]|uniref:Smr/MutS family protein n=1 Tax=Rhodopseudomonas palustris TaxID=1076 RepID=A0A933W280_RHOPL|nr:Smr/MutS family protein [Rhodopseudomonas palustris]